MIEFGLVNICHVLHLMKKNSKQMLKIILLTVPPLPRPLNPPLPPLNPPPLLPLNPPLPPLNPPRPLNPPINGKQKHKY